MTWSRVWIWVVGLSIGLPVSGLAEELRLRVEFEAPGQSVTPLGDLLSVPGAELWAEPGQPLLPRETFFFVLPHGHAAEEVHLEAKRVEPVGGAFDLAPAQLPMPLSLPKSRMPTPRDAQRYASDDPHPESWARLGAIQFKHGYALVPVTVTPLSYRPLSGRVERLVTAELVLTTKPAGVLARSLRALEKDRRTVKHRADVQASMASYPKQPARGPTRLDPGDYEYLIIAPDVFISLGGEDSLEDLLAERDALGMTGQIVSLEWILANYDGLRPDGAADDATRVRQFLLDAYTEWGSDYVLLVGDADNADVGGESGDALMPVRKLHVDTGHPDAAPDELPSDLYYSCLDGDFDFDADGIYGELGDGPDGGEVDLLAELYVGRAPVDSEWELRNFVRKTLAYEAGAGAWLQQVWMVGELLWNDPANVWGGTAMDELITGTDAGGFTTLGFNSFPFFICNTLYDRDLGGSSWTADDMVNVLNEGPHVVNHLGHSNVTYNMRLMNYHVDDLINAHPFLHYSQGCYNGAFDNRAPPEEGGFTHGTDCIGEHMVADLHGAFASISNSRYGWGSSMTDGPSQRFHRQFWDAFFSEGLSTIGQAQADSKEDNAAGFIDPFIRWVGYESNLLGDPAVVFKKSLNTVDPLLGLYPPQLAFIERVGEPAPASQIIRVRNDGLDSLSFTVSSDQAWVGLSTSSGLAPADVEVTVDPTGLTPGMNTAVLTFESPEAANAPMQAVIEFYLVEVPALHVPHLTSVPRVDGVISAGEYDGALSLPIAPGGGAEVTLYMAVAGSRLHLAVDDSLDSTATDFDMINIYFDLEQDGQWPSSPADDGAYWMMARNGGRIMFIPIYNSGDGAMYDFRNREVDPEGFEGLIGFENNHRVYETALDLHASRVNVGPTGAFSVLILVQNSEQMGAGTTTGMWPPVVPEMDTQIYFGSLDMMPDEAWLGSLPGSIDVQVVHNVETPEDLNLTVLELLGGSVSFSATTSENWVSLEPVSGTTPGDMLVSLDVAGLDVGVHQAQILVEAPGIANSPHAIPVSVEVLPEPARLQVDPDSFELSIIEGDPDQSLVLNVINAGEQEMDLVVSTTGNWLGASPVMLSVPALSEQAVDLSVTTTGLGVGEHMAQVQLETEAVEGGLLFVPVALSVQRINTAPPAPELLSPADGTEVSGQVELLVSPVEDPEGDPVSYQFELLDADDAVVAAGAGMVLKGFVAFLPEGQLMEGTYRWTVTAFDDRDASSGASATWSFALIGERDSGCGCAAGGSTGGGLLMLAALGLLLARRRRT